MTVTTAGVPLNGMCGKLYDAKGNNELIDFAPTGTDGISGHYIQQNVPPGKYVLLFVNCGANIDGVTPDQHYTPVLYGGTWNIRQASLVVVTSGATTNLLDQQIPYGGFVQGTVTDKTIKAPADTPPVAFVPPDGSKFFLRFSWTIVCGNPDGTYNSNTGFQQGVPAGATVIFAPDGWGCSDSQGNFNAGKWMAKKKAVDVSPGNTVTLNGSIVEAAP
ncbi:MAG: hypothetical protein JO208_14555 [Alphaproteobacteria bacterium]|nr:hypothetical protein [Alphaproteobacteria bacterium]